MKIAILNNRPQSTGKGLYSHILAENLRKVSRHRIDLLSNLHTANENFLDRVLWIPPAVKIQELLSSMNQLSFVLRVPKDYDIYHLTNEILSIFSKFVSPCVVTVHDLMAFAFPEPYGRLSASYYQFIYRTLKSATRLICVSDSTRDDIAKYLGRRNMPTTSVIHHGVDHEVFRPRDKIQARRKLGLPPERKLLLHVGNDEPRKNVASVLQVVCNLRKQNREVELIRLGRTSETTTRLVQALHLEGQVRDIKPSVKDLPQVYNAADVFVFPSAYEGFGIPLLEAMASGCPVVASNRTSIPEVLAGTGITVSPFDVPSITSAVEQILDDENLGQDLANRALNRSMNFDWEKCARETMKVYEEVAS
jgi:glycosyltransferase involved in cell wall biosynthesis